MMSSARPIRVRYFALLRDQAGCSGEVIPTAARTLGELWEEVAARHRFSLPRNAVRAAQGDAFAPWDAPLEDGREIAFLPPVAGG